MSRWQHMLSPNKTKPFQYALCVVFGAWLIIKGIVPGWTTPHSDFSNYYVSARLVAQGADLDRLYDDAWFQEQMIRNGVSTPGKFSPFPPITSWIMLPLASLTPLQAQRTFLIFNLFFLIGCVYAWKELTGWTMLESTLIITASGASLTNNLAFGQVYLIMACFLLLAITLIKHGYPALAGVMLGVFTAVKYFPAVVVVGICALAMFEKSSTRKSLLIAISSSAITIIALFVAQFFYFGLHVMKEYLTAALVPHLSSELSGQGMYSFLFQSWDSLSRNLFVYDPQANLEPWIRWDVGRSVMKLLVTALIGIVTIVVLVANRYSQHRFKIFIAVPALASFVMLPASATYHFILLLLPLALLDERVVGPKTRYLVIALYITIGFIPYKWFFDLAESGGLLFAYPRLWLVTSLFIIVCRALYPRASTIPT
jgi:hypothetical protein